jgi:hypothetical protein
VIVGVGPVGGGGSEWESDDGPAIPAVGMVVVCVPDTEQRHHGDQNDVEATPSHFGFTHLYCSRVPKVFVIANVFSQKHALMTTKLNFKLASGYCRGKNNDV